MGAKYHSNWGFNIPNDNLPNNIEVWIDCFYELDLNRESKKFFVNIEPNEIMYLNKDIILNHKKFDYILTYDETLLNNIENSILFEYGTTWIETDKYNYPNKDFSVSMVCGHKTMTRNHILRKELWYKQKRIKIPCDFYISQHGGVDNINSNKILGENKFPLFNSMFHICIENVTINNFFTEKLIDTLLCKSIPIYIGCPNIGNYFNTDSFLIAKDVNEIIEICNNLTPDYYYSKLNSIEYNYKKALEWTDYNSRLANKIKEILNK